MSVSWQELQKQARELLSKAMIESGSVPPSAVQTALDILKLVPVAPTEPPKL